jgi:hypothetical protein
MISLDHGFIFVHVPKTAGTAISRALEPYCRPVGRTLWKSILRQLPVTGTPEAAYFRQHDTADFIRRKLTPPVYDRFMSFAVVRNPFDHAVSHYEFMKQYRHRRHAARIAAMSFRDYLRFRMARRGPFEKAFVRMPAQARYVCDESGRVIVTRLLRFERLAEEWPALTRDLGLPDLPLARVRESLSRQPDAGLAPYYDAETTGMVRRLYAPDFAAFGYPPDPPASPGPGVP